MFSSKDLVERYLEATGTSGRWSATSIEEWDIDLFSDELKMGYKFFFGRISKQGVISDLEERRLGADMDHGFDNANNMYCNMMARDIDHARKILSERHAVVLSTGQWKQEETRS